MPEPTLPVAPPARSRRAIPSLAVPVLTAGWMLTTAATPTRIEAQALDDPSRLEGVASVALRASADWDELITTDAGGATEGQFVEALLAGLRETMAGAERAPAADDDAPGSLLCHVDTFYETGLIVYSVRVSYQRPDAEGVPVIAWLHSSVGSYTSQQLHLIWTLSERCAQTFLDAWTEANPGAPTQEP